MGSPLGQNGAFSRALLCPSLKPGLSLRIYLSGFAMAVTPGKVGEVLKSVLLRQATGTPIATAATIIASQAVISGVFSVASQAINLGYLPRIRVLHSSADAMGQIYVPAANWAVLAGTVLLVLSFVLRMHWRARTASPSPRRWCWRA